MKTMECDLETYRLYIKMDIKLEHVSFLAKKSVS